MTVNVAHIIRQNRLTSLVPVPESSVLEMLKVEEQAQALDGMKKRMRMRNNVKILAMVLASSSLSWANT